MLFGNSSIITTKNKTNSYMLTWKIWISYSQPRTNTIPTSSSSWLLNVMLLSHHHITRIIDDSLRLDKCNNSVLCTINNVVAFKKQCFAQVFYGIFSISNNWQLHLYTILMTFKMCPSLIQTQNVLSILIGLYQQSGVTHTENSVPSWSCYRKRLMTTWQHLIVKLNR